MDLFTLNSELNREYLIENYISMIWTERFKEVGDFELSLPANSRMAFNLQVGTWLGLSDSYRVMVVESVEMKTGAEDGPRMEVKGKSIENIMKDRMAKKDRNPLPDPPEWVIEGRAADTARQVFKHICVDGALSSKDIIPRMAEGRPFPDDSLYEPTDEIKIHMPVDTLYDTIKMICDENDLGFRLTRNLNGSVYNLYFNVYPGLERTSAQTLRDPLIFSSEVGGLENVTELSTSEGYKNVAYVASKAGFIEVYSPGFDENSSGYARNVATVVVDEIDESYPQDRALELMYQRGMAALSLNKLTFAFDAEINQHFPYQYEKDYRLGDKVEFWGASNMEYIMQVTEQIFVSDSEGERAYPTLSLTDVVTPGSWVDPKYGVEWPEMGESEVWGNQ